MLHNYILIFNFCFWKITVHEKSILLALLPASLLAVEEAFVFQWLTQFSLLSMFPLLLRDNLIIPYISLYAIFILIHYQKPNAQNRKYSSPFISFLISSFLFVSFVLHVVYLTVNPPKKYPFLFEAIIMLFCFSQIVLVAVYSNRKQWILSNRSSVGVEKKRI